MEVYLESVQTEKWKTVLPSTPPEDMLARWEYQFREYPEETIEIKELLRSVLQDSNHLHHPKYIGHQVSSPLPLTALCEMVSTLLNNGTAIYEMGPASTMMEKTVLDWMAGLIGYDQNQSGGILTSGGSLGNLTAMLAMRQAMARKKFNHDSWADGSRDDIKMSVLVSEQAHYCIKRAVQIMGWGDLGVLPMPVNDKFQMRTDYLKAALADAEAKGQTVVCFVGSACSTSTNPHSPPFFWASAITCRQTVVLPELSGP